MDPKLDKLLERARTFAFETDDINIDCTKSELNRDNRNRAHCDGLAGILSWFVVLVVSLVAIRSSDTSDVLNRVGYSQHKWPHKMLLFMNSGHLTCVCHGKQDSVNNDNQGDSSQDRPGTYKKVPNQ